MMMTMTYSSRLRSVGRSGCRSSGGHRRRLLAPGVIVGLGRSRGRGSYNGRRSSGGSRGCRSSVGELVSTRIVVCALSSEMK